MERLVEGGDDSAAEREGEKSEDEKMNREKRKVGNSPAVPEEEGRGEGEVVERGSVADTGTQAEEEEVV